MKARVHFTLDALIIGDEEFRHDLERFIRTEYPGGVLSDFSLYYLAALSNEYLALDPGEQCPKCGRLFDPDLEAGESEYEENYCEGCGMLYIWRPNQSPVTPPDPHKAVELSSWDYPALKLIFEHPGTLTESAAQGIIHLFPDLKDRGLIVLDVAGQPFLTPKGINSLREHDPATVSNPPLEVAPAGGGTFVLRPVQLVQIQRRRPSYGTSPAGGVYAKYIKPLPHHVDCPAFEVPGAVCLCNSLYANDALE